MPKLTQLLVIGLDSVDKDLVQQWAGAGVLPTFKSLLENAAWGTTQSPIGLYVNSIWPTFYTGVSPASHGFYNYHRPDLESYERVRVLPDFLKKEPFWNELSRAHKKVAVIDVPKTFPSPDLNGIHLVDWGVHDPKQEGFRTWPPSLAKEVENLFGKDTLGKCDRSEYIPDRLAEFRDVLLRRLEKKTEVSQYFLAKGEWDLFLTVFSEGHCAGHQCWHLHDPGHPRYNAEDAAKVGNPIKEVYIALDKAIGELLQQAGPDTDVMIVSSLGMGPHYNGSFQLDRMLQALENHNNAGSQKPPPGIDPSTDEGFLDAIFKALDNPREEKKYPLVLNALQWIRSGLPAGVGVRRLLRKFKDTWTQAKAREKRDRFKNRKCFEVRNGDAVGAVRVNLVGRESNGQVHPGSEYDDFCQALIQDLMSFTNVESGEPLIKRVLRTADLYQGECLDDLPDLLVEWNTNKSIGNVHSPKTGLIRGEYIKCRSGDHRPEGIFFATGPSFKSGPIGQSVAILDFAPTIASLLGVDLPQAEGRPFVSLI